MLRIKSRLVFVVAFLLLPLSGCGILSIGYNYADAYLRYSINSYTDFSDTQKETIKKEVGIFMAWHRKVMLQEYVVFLQELQQTAESGALLKTEDVRRFRTEVRALYVKTLLPAISPAAGLLSELDAAQVRELAASFARENSKQRDKELGGSRDEQLRKRAERTIDFLEHQVGGFSEGQLEKVRAMNSSLPYATDLYIAQREDNQNRLLELLKNNGSKADIETALNTWLYHPEANRSAADNATMQAFESGSDEMIAAIYQLLSERQKKTLLKNIARYISTFQELASVK
jgi:hypothetical protein